MKQNAIRKLYNSLINNKKKPTYICDKKLSSIYDTEIKKLKILKQLLN